eukprot:gene30500-35520_t
MSCLAYKNNRSQLDALFPEGQELNLNQNNRSQLDALLPEGQELNLSQGEGAVGMTLLIDALSHYSTLL